MKDSLDQLFRTRFQDHEVPVDPGMWKAIQGHLASSAGSEEGLNDLLRDRFNAHEVDVDPSVWQGISSQLGHGVATGTAVVGSAWGWVAAAAGTVLVAAGAWLWTGPDEEPVQAAEQVAQAADLSTDQQPSVGQNVEATNAEVVQEAPAAGTPQGSHVDPPGNAVRGPVSDQGTAQAANSSGPEPVRPAMEPSVATATTGASPAAATPVASGTDRVERIIEELAAQAREEAARPEPVPAPVAANSPADPVEEATVGATTELPKLYMPNVFTPNGDGVNDTYQVVGDDYDRILMKVFAMKNNQLVFSTNTGEPWTGANCEEGMYLVAVEALTSDGRAVTEGKVVWLNRTPMN